MSRSIYWKITIPLIVLVLVTMGVLGFYIVNSTRNTQINNLEAQLLNEAKLVANISTPDFADPANNANLNTIAKSIGSEIGTRVTLIAVDGTVLGDTDQNPATMENHSTRPEVVAALSSGVGQATRYSATLKENMMYVAVPVTDQGKITWYCPCSLTINCCTELGERCGHNCRCSRGYNCIAGHHSGCSNRPDDNPSGKTNYQSSGSYRFG